ncbi:MAG: putative maltokinase, partial [Pararhizobium sp.]
MYMAVAQEDRHPITDIIRQTPQIPDPCQWAIFLRNHDELTLEMVTDQERDYLWQTYAEDSRARINLGIRRRLAPLMKNDRRKIELLNSLLLSMPGTPIVYYGDEIGMGDNYYLGDRDGVRTPMQWSADRNAGFSRANPQQLYLPAIMDPVYGYQAINVETQSADPSSLLNWMRRMISVRKQFSVFGRGTMTLIYPRNRKVLAYVREHEDQRILCVANLSRAAQAVELDLARFRGSVPVELTGRSAFPPIGDLPYLLTLPAYGFFWFILADEEKAPSWHETMPEILPEFITLTARDGRLETALTGRERRQLETEVLPRFLPLQRWFGAKDAAISDVTLTPLGELQNGEHALVACDVEVGGEHQRYFLPLSVRWGEENIHPGAPKLSYTLAKIRRTSRLGALIDGAFDERFAEALLNGMRSETAVENGSGAVRFRGSAALSAIEDFGEPRPLGVEQSNVSIVFSDKVILKLYRRLRQGEQPDVEVARFLTETAHFANTPQFLGAVEYRPAEAEATTLAAAFQFVPNQGDAWEAVVEALLRDIDEHMLGAEEADTTLTGNGFAFPLNIGELLGRRTAELHRAFATPTDDPAFAVEKVTARDIRCWVGQVERVAGRVLSHLRAARDGLPEAARGKAERLLGLEKALDARIAAFAELKPEGGRIRIHGDFHLGQVLVAQNDVMFIDFEGEPRRGLDERREKASPLRDVAGMLRSFDYAAATALSRHAEHSGSRNEAAAKRAAGWLARTTNDFLVAYVAGMSGAEIFPDDDQTARNLIDLFVLQKAMYEIGYELANRPDWVGIPLDGAIALLGEEGAQ